MSSSSATPPATRRIARSYLADLVAAIPGDSLKDTTVVEQLLDRAVSVRHVLRSDQLVLTFDLADDPAEWSTAPTSPPRAGAVDDPAGGSTAGPAADVAHASSAGLVENRDYPGQPGEKVPSPSP